MEMDTSRTLTKILGKRDIDKIPADVLKKLEKYCETNNEQLNQTKLLHNTTQKNIEKLRKEYEKLLSTTQDTTAKKDAAQVNVKELRHQLDAANAEVARLTRQLTIQESETSAYRKERNELIDEKDQLMKASDGKDITINRLQLDLKSLQDELKAAVSEKNDAIARFAEMAAKEQSMDDREKRMEKEIGRLTCEIVTLTDNYNKMSSDLMAYRQDSTSASSQLEIDFNEQTEKLRIAEFTIRQLSESNKELSSQCNGEATRLKDQLNEAVTLMEHYKRELDSNIKLADLHKANFDECQAQTAELTSDAMKLRKNLTETLEKCEELESKLNALESKHQMNLKDKDETIAKLTDEVAAAGDLLKTAQTEHAEKVLEKMFPKAAASNRMLKGNLSLTEIYSRYHNALGDVHRLEVECMHLNTKLECLTIKHQDATSEFERQNTEFRNILRVNEEMTQQMNVIVADQDSLRDKLNVTSLKLANVEKENVQLKYTQKDLARQICNLLNKVETNGNELTSDQQQFKRMRLSNETIRKELITFDNIVELQENNQKLIMKVRELSSKVEKLEEQNIRVKSYEEKMSYLERRLCDGEQARQSNEELLTMITKQKERFKQLYYDAMKYMGKETLTDEVETAVLISSQSSPNITTDSKEKKLLEVEQKLQERLKELKILKEEHNEYRQQATINFDILKEEYDTMERKVKELQSVNSRLQSQSSFTCDQIKSHQNDIAIYKKQIQILEDRNQMYDKTIAKHEMANKHLREEALNTILQLSTAENRCDYLELECRRLLEAQKSVDIENKALHRQKMTASILKSNLELFKISSERSQFEGRVQMEKQLDDHVRQCKTLARQLEDEQNRFREEIESLKRAKESSGKKLTDEQAQTQALRTKLSEAREQIEAKNQQIKNLSEKLQEALTPCKSDNPIAKGNKKIKDLELQVRGKTVEINQLKSELQECETKIQSFTKFKSDWEDETKALKENYDAWKATFNTELQASRLNETNLKSQVDELQQEIRFQLTSSQMKGSNALTQSKMQTEYKEALQKITENNKELRELRTQCHKLKENLQTVEKNYSNEMVSHSTDLKILTLRKEELNKCQEQMQQLKLAKDEADEMLKTCQLEWEETSKKLIEGREELELKVESLEKQTMELVDLLQARNDKLLPLSDETLNESVTNSSIMNRTLSDDEFKEFSSEKLFSVVKYLRREKDIAVTQTDSLKIEKARFLAELDMQNKRINELNIQLNSIKSPVTVSDVVSSAKYEDLRRKVETLNALTDSNIHLRTEKEDLYNKVKHLTEQVNRLEAELLPLQEKNREIVELSEEKIKENTMLRSNITQLSQRVNELAERTSKSPEDFMRLQYERENLAKMLTSEKENLRLVNEQLNSMKTEKARLDQEVAAKTKQIQATIDDRKKSQEEVSNFKQINVRLTLESIEIKANILKKEEELKTMKAELTATYDQLKDSRNKEMQIRRIAKKYKDSYSELKAKEDERLSTKTSDEPAAGSSVNRLEVESVQELNNKLASLQEEINELRKENENLRKHDENQIITDARNRIAALTETNQKLLRDYQVCKNQLQSCEQCRSEHDSAVVTLKSQHEAKIKELLEQDALRQEAIARLTRENETLNTRVNQLHRQFQQQGSKPSTSSGNIEKSLSDPARTANVKPMATPSTQSAPVNLRRGGDTPLASIRPMSVQSSRTVTVLPNSQTSHVVAVQGSSSGSVTTALVPPQQQVHTTGNTSTAEAMSSSPTSSHTDYMPATSSAVVVAVPPMGSTSAESTQEAESLSVNTNESSSASSISSQAVLQQQTVALVSPRVEVVPQNVLAPSQQVVDQNQAASTSGSSSSFLTAMSSHHQASSSNTVTTTQAAGHKRPRDAEGDSSTGVEESSASEKKSPQNKRTRLGEQTFQGVSESGLDVEYQVPTSSQRDQEDDVVAVDSDDDEDENMEDDVAAENFEADNGDTDEIESLGQDEGEGHDLDEDNVPNDNNEVYVDDSSDAPNQSSSGITPSSGTRVNLGEVIELSSLRQETQQIQTISSGSDAGPSGQANLWRQAQTPSRQQQQQSLVIQQTYDEVTDDSIVPSTPTLYVARRADGFSEAISSPHPIVPHGSRFSFGDLSGSSLANRAVVATLVSGVDGLDDTRIELNLLDGSSEGGHSSSTTNAAVQHAVNADTVDEGASNLNKKSDEPMAGPSSQAHGSQTPVAKKKRKTDDDASTTNAVENVIDEVESAEGGSDGVSSEGEKTPMTDTIQVEEDREAEASVLPRNTRSRRIYQRGRGMSIDNQRQNQVMWHQADNFGRYHQMQHHQQQHGNSHRGSPTRGPLTRGGRGRPRRPYR